MNEQEKLLRENIRQLIRHVKQKRLNEEQEVRNSLKKLMRLELKKMLSEINTPDTDPTPNKSTGINVLEDQNLREGIKKFSEWPTIPQLYINREFIGGCDIVKEMYENGELKEVLKKIL